MKLLRWLFPPRKSTLYSEWHDSEGKLQNEFTELKEDEPYEQMVRRHYAKVKSKKRRQKERHPGHGNGTIRTVR